VGPPAFRHAPAGRSDFGIELMTESEMHAVRHALLDKKFNGTLSEEEEIQLLFIRDALDQIEMDRMKPDFDRLEQIISQYEKVALEIREMLKWVNSL
jgi:hypothetical protein